ncbi:MAG: DUF3881 family protein [Lachnospiraceae bacterium]|nr:DUF3881 family protein [Lachnospiraceae bacterium]
MHDFLRSIGFRSLNTRKEMDKIIDWVLEKPDSLSIVSTGRESNMAQANRDIAGHAGISVVGEIDETGKLIPEFYFPYIGSTHTSSEAQITAEKQVERNGFVGMLEDHRLGTALIFTVRNHTDAMKRRMDDFYNIWYRKVNLSALGTDGIILLGQEISEKVLKQAEEDKKKRRRLMREAHEGDASAMETIARNDIHKYHLVMRRLEETDVYTVVKSFLMPYGIETERYYFLAAIKASQLVENPFSHEKFYRLLLEVNEIEMVLAINEKDLTGIPEPGRRIRCHAWFMGEIH